jgi:FMN phosphatase YigB (HAD superfamily)
MREKKYVIFCDMDGVLVDFDEGYKELTGVTTQHADSQGKNEFWKLYRDSLKDKDISERSYWANLDWMPDGKQLWDYIKEYNPYVLTAPSVNFDIPFEERYKLENNESMQGKTEWVQRLPNMRKIYFRSAARKADFAGPNKILIDDRKDTIDSWNANGGIGILHTSTANTIKQLQELGL